MPDYDRKLTVDASHGPTGWGVLIRPGGGPGFGWVAPGDDELREFGCAIGAVIVNALIADRDRRETAT
jgi:hypothetical protein